MVKTNELQRSKKKQTYLISPTLEKKKTFREDFFFTEKEKFPFLWQVRHFQRISSHIRLQRDCRD